MLNVTESPQLMLAHLVLSIAFGLIAALTAAVMGHGIGHIALVYFGGCWGGFLFSIALQLILRTAFPSSASARVQSATS